MPNETINDGPAPGREASPAAAVPTVAKMPAPIIAPIPSSVILIGPSVRLSLWPSSCAAARMSSRFLVRKIPRSKIFRLTEMDSIPHTPLLPRSLRFRVGSFKLQGLSFRSALIVGSQATSANPAGYFAITANKREILTCLVNLKLETGSLKLVRGFAFLLFPLLCSAAFPNPRADDFRIQIARAPRESGHQLR